MTSREKVKLPITGHSCCNKKFQILLISDWDQLADDANENHHYIAMMMIMMMIITMMIIKSSLY